MKKQFPRNNGFFKGKARKSLEGKIEQAEKQEKRIHTDMEQTVKQAGYSDVQSFTKTYQKSEKLIRKYNEELRAWENQTEQKEEKPSEPPKKGKHTGKVTPLPAGKQTAAKTVSKEEIYGQRTMRKVEQNMKKKQFFEEMGGIYVRCGITLSPTLPCRRKKEPRFVGVWGQRHFAVFERIPQDWYIWIC